MLIFIECHGRWKLTVLSCCAEHGTVEKLHLKLSIASFLLFKCRCFEVLGLVLAMSAGATLAYQRKWRFRDVVHLRITTHYVFVNITDMANVEYRCQLLQYHRFKPRFRYADSDAVCDMRRVAGFHPSHELRFWNLAAL